MRRFLSIYLVVALAISALPGCASKYGEKKTVVNYYPRCYAPIQDLRDREHDVAKQTAGGAVVGALGGALVGLLASGGKWQGAVVGAAAGGVTGAVAGNIYARKQQEADDNKRLASYLQDLDGDISNLNVVTAAAKTSLQCYNEQFRALVSQIKAKQIDRATAQKRYAEITSGREEALNILGEALNNANDLNQQYQQAFMSEEQNLNSPKSMARGKSAVQQNRRQLNAARQRQKTLQNGVKESQNVLASGKQESISMAREYESLALASERGTQ